MKMYFDGRHTKQAFNNFLQGFLAFQPFNLLPRNVDQAFNFLEYRDPNLCKYAVCQHGGRLHKVGAVVQLREHCAPCASGEQDVVRGIRW